MLLGDRRADLQHLHPGVAPRRRERGAPLRAQVVAEDQRAPWQRRDRATGGEGLRVDGLAQPHDGRAQRQRADPPGDPVGHHDDGVDGAVGHDGELVVVQVGVRDVHDPRPRVARGQRRRGDRVVGQDGVACLRQVGLRARHGQAPALGAVGRRAQLGGVQHGLVAEAEELAGHRRDVRLRPAGAGERIGSDDHA